MSCGPKMAWTGNPNVYQYLALRETRERNAHEILKHLCQVRIVEAGAAWLRHDDPVSELLGTAWLDHRLRLSCGSAAYQSFLYAASMRYAWRTRIPK